MNKSNPKSTRQQAIKVITAALNKGLTRKDVLKQLSKKFPENSMNYFNTLFYQVKRNMKETES